jgi:hypothetical protein
MENSEMNMMTRAFLISGSFMAASLAHAQPVSSVPNVQTGAVPPSAAPPATSSDPSGITPADSGSSIDKPATVGAMPQTGYHEPVIRDSNAADPPPHERARASARAGLAHPPIATERRQHAPSRRRVPARRPR